MTRPWSSSDRYAATFTPKSTPTPGKPFAGASGVSDSMPKDTCQPSASTLTVALRTVPPSGRDSRNRTGPSFGSRTCAHFRFQLLHCDRLPGERHRQGGAAFAEGGGAGRVLRVPPVVVRLVHRPQDLLGALRGQVGDPIECRAGFGEFPALPGRSQGPAAFPPQDLALHQRGVPDRPAGVSPPGQPLGLFR